MSKTLDILLLFCYLKNVKSILHFVLQKGEKPYADWSHDIFRGYFHCFYCSGRYYAGIAIPAGR